jgi:hypothetical protein
MGICNDQDSRVCIPTIPAGWPRRLCSLPGRGKHVFLYHNVHTGFGATAPPAQWVPEVLPLRIKRQ